MHLVDDDDRIRTSPSLFFGKNGVLPASAAAEEASDHHTHHEADLVITD